MNLQKKQNLRMCVAVGAAAGAGPAIYHSVAQSIGWMAALGLCGLISAVVAIAASAVVGMIVKVEEGA
jgi:hypothetical protein